MANFVAVAMAVSVINLSVCIEVECFKNLFPGECAGHALLLAVQ